MESGKEKDSITEGGIKLKVPDSHATPKGREAFYNPAMKINRDLVMCGLAAAREQFQYPMWCLDGFAGSGISGLRWLKDVGPHAYVTPEAGSSASSKSSDEATTTTPKAEAQAGTDSKTVPSSDTADTSHREPTHPLIVSFCDANATTCQFIEENCRRNSVDAAIENRIESRLLYSVEQDSSATCTQDGEESKDQSASVSASIEPSAKRAAASPAVVVTTGLQISGEATASAGAAIRQDRAHIYCCDVNVLLHMQSFGFIHLDPFGSCAPFLDAAVSKSHKGAVIAISSTDCMSLFGTLRNVAARNYAGARVHRTSFGRELAARLLYTVIAHAAARHMKSIEPLFAVSQAHFATVIVRLGRGGERADECVDLVQKLYYCEKCHDSAFVPVSTGAGPETLPCTCSQSPDAGRLWVELGPIWAGRIFDVQFVRKMAAHANQLSTVSNSARSTLKMCAEEAVVEAEALSRIDDRHMVIYTRPCSRQAAFYQLLGNHGKKGFDTPSTKLILDGLRRKGYLAARSSFEKSSLRTTASVSELNDVIHKDVIPSTKKP